MITAQKGNPSAAEVIARSIAEPSSRSKNAKIWAMPSKAPRANPKPTFRRAKQRKGLESDTAKQTDQGATHYLFHRASLKSEPFGFGISRSMQRLEISHNGSGILGAIFFRE